jgi:hypothetical protein
MSELIEAIYAGIEKNDWSGKLWPSSNGFNRACKVPSGFAALSLWKARFHVHIITRHPPSTQVSRVSTAWRIDFQDPSFDPSTITVAVNATMKILDEFYDPHAAISAIHQQITDILGIPPENDIGYHRHWEDVDIRLELEKYQ